MVTDLENLVKMGMTEGIGFSGFRKKKIEREHRKLSSDDVLKGTRINCSLLLWLKSYTTNSGQFFLYKQKILVKYWK